MQKALKLAPGLTICKMKEIQMITAVSNATASQPVAQPTSTPSAKPAAPKPTSTSNPDSVQISQLGQTIAAAVQEDRETPAQTAQEANRGDSQAERFLAREVAAKPVAK